MVVVATVTAGRATRPTPDGLTDPADALGDLNALVPAFRRAFGDRFGFVDIDRASTAAPRLRLALVGATAADEAVARDIAPTVTVARVPVSGAQFDAWKQAIGAAMVGKQSSMVLFADHERGTLLLLASALGAEDVAAFRAAVPDGVLEVVVGDPDFRFGFDHATRTELPHEAGLQLTAEPARLPGPSQEGALCTTGFHARHDFGDDVFDYGVTAGHCAPTGSRIDVGRTHVSNAGTNSFHRANPASSDATRYFVASRHTDSPPRVMTGRGGHRRVRGAFTNAGLVVGTRVCFQGAVSLADNCGDIVAAGVPITAPDPGGGGTRTVSQVWCIDAASHPGDSGGPHYHVNRDGSATAAGIHSGGGTTSSGAPFACFSSWQDVAADLNVTLVTT